MPAPFSSLPRRSVDPQPVRWLKVRNVDTTPVPPYGCMQIVGQDGDKGSLQIQRPSADGASNVLFNSSVAIQPGLLGQGTRAYPAIALFVQDATTGTMPVNGAGWGPAAGDWALHLGKAGFQVVGSPVGNQINVMPLPTAAAAPQNYSLTVRDLNNNPVDANVTIIDSDTVPRSTGSQTYYWIEKTPGVVGIHIQEAAQTQAGIVNVTNNSVGSPVQQILGSGPKGINGSLGVGATPAGGGGLTLNGTRIISGAFPVNTGAIPQSIAIQFYTYTIGQPVGTPMLVLWDYEAVLATGNPGYLDVHYAVIDHTGAFQYGKYATMVDGTTFSGGLMTALGHLFQNPPPIVSGSRSSGAALQSLLAALVSLGLIQNQTTP